MSKKTRFLFYLLRWQLSGFVLVPVLWGLDQLNITNFIVGACIANLAGGSIFWFVDRLIFKK